MNLTEKYRPTKFSEVLGQSHAVVGLEKMLSERSHASILFSGPSGVGKTTLARIAASALDCTDLREIDAASNSGIDAMKALAKNQQYYAPSNGSRVFIIDECQQLSKSAWNSLLKDIENPPPGNFWVFCTTEISKVPRTIRTRCAEFKLKAVSNSDLFELVKSINTMEEMGVSDETLRRIVSAVGGSPRQAVVMLQQVRGLSEAEVTGLLEAPEGLPQAFTLARLLIQSDFSLKEAMELLKDLKNESPEGIRQVVRAYMTTVVLNSPRNRHALLTLKAFETPAIEQNQISDIVLKVMTLDKWRKG